MKPFLTLLLVTLCAATSYGQTMKALSYNTNGRIAYSGTNELMFTNAVGFAEGDLKITEAGGIAWAGQLKYEPESQTFFSALAFSSTNVSAATRTNLSLGAAWLTNGNVTNFRTAIGLGATNSVSIGEDGGSLTTDDLNAGNVNVSFAVTFTTNTAAAATRTNLGLGATWLTNTNVTNFRSAINVASATNYDGVADKSLALVDNDGNAVRLSYDESGGDEWIVSNPLSFRTAIGLPLPALTNTSNVTMMRALAGSTNTNEPFSGTISVTGTNNTNTLVFSNGILQSVQ